MKHIVLACAGGMSTSLLMNKMKAAAQSMGVDVDIQAMSVNAFAKYTGEVDLLLLGPQISYRLKQMQDACAPRGIAVAVVDRIAYGTMNGEMALKSALDAMA